MDENSKISIDMAYKGIEEALRALKGENMALKSEREKLFKELQERGSTVAGNLGIIETLDAEREELERVCEEEFYVQEQLEAEMFAEGEKLMICKSMLADLKESAAEAQVAASASREWKYFVKDLNRTIESTGEKLEDNKAELEKALQAEQTALNESRQLLQELESLKEAQSNVMREVEKKSTELATSTMEIKDQCETVYENESALMDTVAAMEEEVSKLEKTRAELVESRGSWERRYTERCVYVKQLEEKCQVTEMKNSELQAQVKGVEQSLGKIRDALDQQEKRKDQLEREFLTRTQNFSNELNVFKEEEQEILKELQILENEAATVHEVKAEESVKTSELTSKVLDLGKAAELVKFEMMSTLAAIESAQREINGVNEKIIIEESKISKQDCELLAQSELLRAKEEDVERLSQKHSLLQAKSQDMDRNLAKLTEDSGTEKKKTSKKKDLICNQREAIGSVKQEIEKLMMDRDARAIEVHKNMDCNDAEISSLESEIMQLKNRLAGHNDEYAEMLETLKSKQHHVLALDKEMKDTEITRSSYLTQTKKDSDDEAEKFELKKVEIRSAFEQILAEIEDCEKEMGELEKIQAQDLLSSEEQLKDKISEKELNIQALGMQIDLAEEKMQNLHQEIEPLQKNTAGISTYVEEVTAEIANLRMELAKKEEEISVLKADIQNSENSHAGDLSSLKDRQNQEIIQKNLQIKNLTQQQEEALNKMSAFESEIASLNESVSQLLRNLSSLTEEDRSLVKAKNLANARRTKLQKQLAATKKAQSNSCQEVDLVTKKLATAKKDVSALNDEVASKDNELEELTALMEERTSKRDSLAHELASKKDELSSIGEKIKVLRDEGKTLKADAEFFKKLNECSSNMTRPSAAKVDLETLSPMTISPILPPEGNPLDFTFLTSSDVDSDREGPPAKITKKPIARPGIVAGNNKGKNKVDAKKTGLSRGRGSNFRHDHEW